MDPLEIYLGFSTTTVWLSRLIRKATGSRYSHCWVRHPSAVWGGTWVTHADWPVVRTWPWEIASRGWSVEQLYRPRFDIVPALQAVRKDFEERYDIPGLFGMALVVVAWRWFHRKIRNPLAGTNALFCSEFIAQILQAAKLPGTEGWESAGLDPKTVEKYCADHPELFEKVKGDAGVPLPAAGSQKPAA